MSEDYAPRLTPNEGMFISRLLDEEASSHRLTIEEGVWRRELAARIHPGNPDNMESDPDPVGKLTKEQAKLVLWVLNDYQPPRPDSKFLNEILDGRNEQKMMARAYAELMKMAGEEGC